MSSGYHLVPLATASIILAAIIHCFMGVARRHCDFILQYTRGILLLAHQMQEAQSHAFLLANMNRIPATIDTALRYLNLQADLDFYVVCPKCCTLYAQNNAHVPEICQASYLDKPECGSPLFQEKHRGTSTWRSPLRQYTHQRLEVWLSRFLNRPGIEDLIEATRPTPQSIVTDFWGAPYLNDFPGAGAPSFFDTEIENLRLAFLVYHDFFNPFSNKMAGKQRSVGIVLMVCLNLPPEIRYNHENLYAASVIPGPSEPSGDEINHFMHPIVENLLQHFNPGVWISRTRKYPNGQHVRSAVVVESMDLIASRQWSGLGSPTHTFLCSCCWIPQQEIDKFTATFRKRTLPEHLIYVQRWQDAATLVQRQDEWKRHAARYSEMLAFPWWDPFTVSTVAPMHWSRNVLERQLRENMGWSWQLSTGIPTSAKVVKPVSVLEVQWGNSAIQYLTTEQFAKAKLTAPLIRHMCNERGIFNDGLPSRRMIEDLNIWVSFYIEQASLCSAK
jgi:hypothetical protein